MILAAGRGRRLAPLTDRIPKPLLEIGGETLIERHLARLAAAGFREVVINLSHLGEAIETRLGDGRAYDLRIAYSREPEGALETGGGITQALPLLGSAPFLVINADIWTDFPFAYGQRPAGLAHLVLVPNPPHHPMGDFELNGGWAERQPQNRYTYAGIGIYQPEVFFQRAPGSHFALAPLLFELALRGQLSAEIHRGRWFDIGTPERLAAARQAIAVG